MVNFHHGDRKEESVLTDPTYSVSIIFGKRDEVSVDVSGLVNVTIVLLGLMIMGLHFIHSHGLLHVVAS